MNATIVLLENDSQFNLFPFTLTRSVADLRIGILTIREKWELLHAKTVHVVERSGANTNNQSITIPANLVPGAYYNKENTNDPEAFRMIQYPWELIEHNRWAIEQDYFLLTKDRISQTLPLTVKTTRPEHIFIEEGASLEHCFIHAGDGPVYIGKNALIMDGAMLRGPVSIGEGAVVKMGATIYGATSIGPFCIVGGEIKNSIIMAYSNKAHHGYLGDSVVGEWCNLGAGTSCSNLKNTGGKIKVWNMHTQTFHMAGNKCGLFMGDFCKSAINTSFNSGTVTGICSNIFDGMGLTPKFIPSFAWGGSNDKSYTLEKALLDIETWMAFKNRKLTAQTKHIITKIYSAQKNQET